MRSSGRSQRSWRLTIHLHSSNIGQPSLRTVQYTHGHSCESCKAFGIKDGLYYCGRLEVNVGSGQIRDEYEFGGAPYKPTLLTLTTKRSELLGGRKIHP